MFKETHKHRQLDRFGDKYTLVTPSPQSMHHNLYSPPKVSSHHFISSSIILTETLNIRSILLMILKYTTIHYDSAFKKERKSAIATT